MTEPLIDAIESLLSQVRELKGEYWHGFGDALRLVLRGIRHGAALIRLHLD